MNSRDSKSDIKYTINARQRRMMMRSTSQQLPPGFEQSQIVPELDINPELYKIGDKIIKVCVDVQNNTYEYRFKCDKCKNIDQIIYSCWNCSNFICYECNNTSYKDLGDGIEKHVKTCEKCQCCIAESFNHVITNKSFIGDNPPQLQKREIQFTNTLSVNNGLGQMLCFMMGQSASIVSQYNSVKNRLNKYSNMRNNNGKKV